MTVRPSPTRRLRWALARRCPNCGSGGLFRRWLDMQPICPRCELTFERMPGYWLGAMILNFAMTAGAFLAVFGVWLAATWPDPPWTTLWIGSMVVAVVTPVVVFPWTRTLFSALELSLRPPEDGERGTPI